MEPCALPAASTSPTSHSPKQLYKQQCVELSLHCNTRVLKDLPLDQASLNDVTLLDFSRNCLGRNGIKPLLLVLRMCQNLEAINLSENYLSNASVVELVRMLEQEECCRKLTHLDLSRNPISNPSGKLLSQLVDRKVNLRRVVVKGTLMNPGLARLIDGKLASRSDAPPRSTAAAVVSLDGLRVLGEVAEQRLENKLAAEGRDSGSIAAAAGPSCDDDAAANSPQLTPPRKKIDVSSEDWSAMETIWNLAAVAAPPADGWTGLASVMALVRRDASIAAMY